MTIFMLFCESFAHEGLSYKTFPSPSTAFARTSFTRTCFSKFFTTPLTPFPKGDLVTALLRYDKISLFMKRFVTYVLCKRLRKCQYFNTCNATGRLPGRVSVGLKTWITFLSVTGKYGIFCNRSREIFGEMYNQFIANGLDIFSLSCILRHYG